MKSSSGYAAESLDGDMEEELAKIAPEQLLLYRGVEDDGKLAAAALILVRAPSLQQMGSL